MNYYKGWTLSFNQTRPPAERWRAVKEGTVITATTQPALKRKIDKL